MEFIDIPSMHINNSYLAAFRIAFRIIHSIATGPNAYLVGAIAE